MLRTIRLVFEVQGWLSLLVVCWGVYLLSAPPAAASAIGALAGSTILGAGLAGMLWGFGISAVLASLIRLEDHAETIAAGVLRLEQRMEKLEQK